MFDVSLVDEELLIEVELTTTLMIAASKAATSLTQAQIDAALGLVPAPA